MKTVAAFVAACLVMGALAADSKVVVLTKDNFDEKTKEGLWLIKFFAPWCGHCKRLAPTWIELAGKAEGSFNVGEVDCTAHKDLCQKFGVRGYPTIKFIANGGNAEDVRVPRTVEAYMDYMKKYVKVEEPKAEEKVEEPKAEEKKVEEPKAEEPKAEEKKAEEPKVEKKAEVLSLTKETFDVELGKKPLAVKFFAPWCGHCKRLAPTWKEFAESRADAPYTVAEVDCTQQSELCSRFKVRGYPTILFVKSDSNTEYNGARTLDGLQKWADKLAEPKEHSEL